MDAPRSRLFLEAVEQLVLAVFERVDLELHLGSMAGHGGGMALGVTMLPIRTGGLGHQRADPRLVGLAGEVGQLLVGHAEILAETAEPPADLPESALGELLGHDGQCMTPLRRPGHGPSIPRPLFATFAILGLVAAGCGGGDSAGGNLAAAVALVATDRRWDLCHQLLVYPVIAPDFTTGSYTDNAEGYFLTRRAMQWFWDQYATPDQRRDHRVNPLNADPALLAKLPPAWIFTAQYDPLRDEGRRYAAAMAAVGVTVERSHADDMIHGVFATSLEAGEEVRAQAADSLRAAFANVAV